MIKECVVCKKNKRLDDFPSVKYCKDVKYHACNDCMNIHLSIKVEDKKKCRTCHKAKPYDQFQVVHDKCGTLRVKSSCKECILRKNNVNILDTK